MMSTTLIRKADWAIAWDNDLKTHQYLQNADVVFAGNTIKYVGNKYNGKFERLIDGNGLCVMPGLVNIHAHPFTETMNKGFVEDGKNGQCGEFDWFNNLLSYSPCENDMALCSEVGFSELLLSGVTTLVDISLPYNNWLNIAEKSGLRMYLAPMFTSTEGMWEIKSSHEMVYRWAKDRGKSQLDLAISIIDQAISNDNSLLNGMVMPAQVDTCHPDLLRDSLDASLERGIPLQIHAAQLVTEFQEINKRHGISPIQFLNEIGILSPKTIISHAILLDHHPSVKFWGTEKDLGILAGSGASVAHCPSNYVRTWAMVLQNFAAYNEMGVNIGIGTDSFPHNILEEMRLAIMLCRTVTGHVESITTSDIFNAATIGGANALHRDDIGRLTPGAKADFVLIDLTHPTMKPVRDPLRSLIFQAADRAVRDVYIDGKQVVANGQVLTLDYQGSSEQLENIRYRMEEKLPKFDWAGRNTLEISPLSIPCRKMKT